MIRDRTCRLCAAPSGKTVTCLACRKEAKEATKRGEATKRQLAVLEAIVNLDQELGYPPTMAEVSKAMGVSVPNGCYSHLVALARKGLLAYELGKARTMRVTEKGIQALWF